ncbi:MAG: formate dehydrogenase subunit gamma [Acidobacteriaceae bacterium]
MPDQAMPKPVTPAQSQHQVTGDGPSGRPGAGQTQPAAQPTPAQQTTAQQATAGPAKQPEERYFQRFTVKQRWSHAIMLTTFLGLAATGLSILFSSNAWAQRFAALVGGFDAILFLHKLCAVTLTAVFLYHVYDLMVRIFIKKEKGILWGPTSMVPNLKDLKHMIGNFRWFLGLGPKPTAERYAYWEKFDYWAVFWGMVIIGSSGYVMWFGPFFGRFLPGWALNAVQIVHGEEALLAITFIFSIHFFNSHGRPDCFPMDTTIFTGVASEEEFKQRHLDEYQRLAAEGKLEEKLTVKPQPGFVTFAKVMGFTAVFIGLVLFVLTVRAYFRI